jgi:phospholipase/lecithinase/hemolysin
VRHRFYRFRVEVWILGLVVLLLAQVRSSWAAGFIVPNPYAASTSAADITIRKLFVFGDSYSRAGRKPWHNWAEQLRYDVLNRNSKLPEARLLVDYAVGAATGGIYPSFTNDFGHQVTGWLAVKRSFDQRDLGIVYFGYNDFNRSTLTTGADLAQAAGDYKGQLQRLVDAGLGGANRRILLVMPHDWGHTPYHAMHGQSAAMRQRTQIWNGLLADIAKQSAFANFVAVDLFTAMECVFQQPADFGFVDVGLSRPANGDPAKYLYDYNDAYHFAAKGQMLIRQVVQYYLTRGWDWANTFKDPATARQKLVADLQAGKVFTVKCTSLAAPAPSP